MLWLSFPGPGCSLCLGVSVVAVSLKLLASLASWRLTHSSNDAEEGLAGQDLLPTGAERAAGAPVVEDAGGLGPL